MCNSSATKERQTRDSFLQHFRCKHLCLCNHPLPWLQSPSQKKSGSAGDQAAGQVHLLRAEGIHTCMHDSIIKVKLSQSCFKGTLKKGINNSFKLPTVISNSLAPALDNSNPCSISKNVLDVGDLLHELPFPNNFSHSVR